MYIADGDYIKDIEVNDLRNRYTLTKGATQKMVNIDPSQVVEFIDYFHPSITSHAFMPPFWGAVILMCSPSFQGGATEAETMCKIVLHNPLVSCR
jgi:hypothetical protein